MLKELISIAKNVKEKIKEHIEYKKLANIPIDKERLDWVGLSSAFDYIEEHYQKGFNLSSVSKKIYKEISNNNLLFDAIDIWNESKKFYDSLLIEGISSSVAKNLQKAYFTLVFESKRTLEGLDNSLSSLSDVKKGLFYTILTNTWLKEDYAFRSFFKVFRYKEEMTKDFLKLVNSGAVLLFTDEKTGDIYLYDPMFSTISEEMRVRIPKELMADAFALELSKKNYNNEFLIKAFPFIDNETLNRFSLDKKIKFVEWFKANKDSILFDKKFVGFNKATENLKKSIEDLIDIIKNKTLSPGIKEELIGNKAEEINLFLNLKTFNDLIALHNNSKSKNIIEKENEEIASLLKPYISFIKNERIKKEIDNFFEKANIVEEKTRTKSEKEITI